MTRRILIRWLLSFLAVLPFRRVRLFAQVRSLTDTDIATLRELAEAALPTALGREGTDAVVEKFLRWLENYRVGVEMSPGYGVPRTRLTPELDVSSYAPQLDALREAMRKERDAGTTDGTLSTRQRLIRASLEEAGVDELSSRPDGRHVVGDLLSFYVRSSEARDLCYEADIGRYTCPGLAGLAEKPAPLSEG